MDAQMKELLEKIKATYDKLERNIHGEYIGINKTTKIGEPGCHYTIHAQELSQQIHELYDTYHPDFLSQLEIGNFMHTLDKEVAYVEDDYQESLKHKDSQKKKDKVCKSIKEANQQIRLDLWRLFQILDELQ